MENEQPMTAAEIERWVGLALDHPNTVERRLVAAIRQMQQQQAEAQDLIRRLYGSFRWETYTDQQETACRDAEAFLDLPPEQRREWDDGK